MSEQEFAVLLAEFRQLRRAISDAVTQILHQEEEIKALQWFIQQKRLATQEELEVASREGARLVEKCLGESYEELERSLGKMPGDSGLSHVAGRHDSSRKRANGACRRRVRV